MKTKQYLIYTTIIFFIICSITYSAMASSLEDLYSKGLIAYYPFEGNANDSINENHGIEHGGVKYIYGVKGQAASFDGIDDFIEIKPKTNVSSIRDFTISVWVYLIDWKKQKQSTKDRQYIFDGHSHSKTAVSDFYRPGFCMIYDGNSNTEEIHNLIYYSPDKLEQNMKFNIKGQWHHMVFMRIGNNEYTFMDARLICSKYAAFVKKDNFLNMQHKWFIGTFSGNNPNYVKGIFNYSFYGMLDEMRIYSRGLSCSEILALYYRYEDQNCTICVNK